MPKLRDCENARRKWKVKGKKRANFSISEKVLKLLESTVENTDMKKSWIVEKGIIMACEEYKEWN